MIKICSKYDLSTYKAFIKYTSRRVLLFTYICGGILLLIGIFFAFASIRGYSMYLTMSVVLPISIHAYYKYIIYQAMKNKLLISNTVQTFEFNDEGVALEQTSQGVVFKDFYLYKEIYSIIKYKEYYFIYINRAQAFIINNNDYILGDEEKLDSLFSNAIHEKFIIKGARRQKKS